MYPAKTIGLAMIRALTMTFFVKMLARLSILSKAPLDPKEWTKQALDRGRAAYLAGRLRRSESLSKPLLDNAVAMFRDRGVVAQGEGKGGKLSLAPASASAEKLSELTGEVDLFFS